MDGVVDDVNTLVGTHLQRLADGVGGVGRADGQDRDLALAGLDDLQRLLDGVLVELGQQAVDTFTVDGVVGVELSVCGGVWDVLHRDNDVGHE